LASRDTFNKQKIDIKLHKSVDCANNEARQKITDARINLVLKHGFFGQLAMRLKLVNASTWCTTAATDGRNFYYHEDFINMLDRKQVVFLFCHELLHCAYNHMGRGVDRDPKLSNIAADYIVNGDCIQHNLGEKITQVPLLHDKKYDGWSYEQVYEDLHKNAKKNNVDDLFNQLLDDHIMPDKDGGGNKNPQQGSGRPTLTQEEADQIKDEFKEWLISAAQGAQAGELPGRLSRLVKDLTEPQIDWKQLLTNQIQATVSSDYTYTVPNKKMFSSGFSFPSLRKDETVDVHISIDTSGSIDEKKFHEFLSEVYGIMGQYDSYKIHIWCFDTEVHNPQVFEDFNADEFLDYEAKGFGGTRFRANWDYMIQEDVNPKILIVFTDGENFGDDWGDPDHCPTVWIISNSWNRNIKAPFGTWAYLETDGLQDINQA
jgi:predicted metal-dependent peptidase